MYVLTVSPFRPKWYNEYTKLLGIRGVQFKYSETLKTPVNRKLEQLTKNCARTFLLPFTFYWLGLYLVDFSKSWQVLFALVSVCLSVCSRGKSGSRAESVVYRGLEQVGAGKEEEAAEGQDTLGGGGQKRRKKKAGRPSQEQETETHSYFGTISQTWNFKNILGEHSKIYCFSLPAVCVACVR